MVRMSIRIVLLAGVAFLPFLAAPQGTAPGKVSARPTPTPTPTPTPPPKPPLTVAPAANQPKAAPATPKTTAPGTAPAMPKPASSVAPGAIAARPTPASTPNPSLTSAQAPVSSAFTPVHSPDQLLFGTVWQGDMAKQTLHFQSIGTGYIHIDIPSPFRVSEIRALTSGGSSKNSGKGASQIPLGPQVKTRVSFTPNQPGPYTALIDASTDVDLDVVFQPQVQAGLGDKSAIMKITGPGSIHDWGFSIPLHGSVQAGLEAGPNLLWAIDNDEGAYLDIIIHGTGNGISGTLKGGSVLPPGVSITPQTVNVPAVGTVQTKLWLDFNGIATDSKARPLQVVFAASNHSTTRQIQFAGLPDLAFDINSADRGDCGVSRASLSLHVSPPHQYKKQSTKGKLGWVFLAWNFDMANERYVEMSADSGGVQLFDRAPFVVPMRNMDEYRRSSPYIEDLDLSAEQWAKILQGPARFGCQQWDVTPGGAIARKESVKWAPAVKGLKF